MTEYDKNISLDDLPEISNRNHRDFILNYAGGMSPLESYHAVYGTDMKRTSAKASASALLGREDYQEFLQVYSKLKVKKQLEAEIGALAEALNPSEIILELKESAARSRFTHPGVTRDINLELLEISGAKPLIKKIVLDSLRDKGYKFPEDEVNGDSDASSANTEGKDD